MPEIGEDTPNEILGQLKSFCCLRYMLPSPGFLLRLGALNLSSKHCVYARRSHVEELELKNMAGA